MNATTKKTAAKKTTPAKKSAALPATPEEFIETAKAILTPRAAAKKPAAKKTAAKKTTPAKKTTSKAAAAAKKLAAPPVAAKKTTAKKSPAKKTPAARVDLVSAHIEEVFAKLRKGTQLKVSEIVAVRTKSFPLEGTRPAVTTVQGRCRDSIKLPKNVESVKSPCGLKRV